MKWSVTPRYIDANHEPIIRIEGPLEVLAAPGETIRLNGAVSDPDENKLSVKWGQFRVGTYLGEITISNATSAQCRVTVPKEAVAGQTIHFILEATDDGMPALTRYQRVIVTVRDSR